MILRVRTSLREMLDKLPATLVAELIDRGWLDFWPLQITRRGRQHIQLVFSKGKLH